MAIVIFWVIKIFSWAGLIFSLYSVVQPGLMLKLYVKSIQFKLRWFGMEGQIRPGPQAQTLTRVWSVVTALIFAGLVYVFTYVVEIGYVLK